MANMQAWGAHKRALTISQLNYSILNITEAGYYLDCGAQLQIIATIETIYANKKKWKKYKKIFMKIINNLLSG